jgi:hypothetical protein
MGFMETQWMKMHLAISELFSMFGEQLKYTKII